MTRHAALVLVLCLGWSSSVAGNPNARIYFLDLRGKLVSATPDGGDRKVLIEGMKGQPDGIAVDVEAGHIYWTNMGDYAADDGSIERSNLDGSNVTTIVKTGGTWTGKQLVLDQHNGKLYWSDREGLRVMRANLDGSALETLVETGRGDEARKDQRNWCVGMAVDVAAGKIYWTQKGGDNANAGTIRRANLDIPRGQTALNRTDIEVLFDGLPEPIDLELDLAKRHLYWTDRGNPPDGNTVNRASMDSPRSRHHPGRWLRRNDWDCARPRGRADVSDRFARERLQPEAGRLRSQDAVHRARYADRDCVRGRDAELVAIDSGWASFRTTVRGQCCCPRRRRRTSAQRPLARSRAEAGRGRRPVSQPKAGSVADCARRSRCHECCRWRYWSPRSPIEACRPGDTEASRIPDDTATPEDHAQ